jgi:hypothetical protein
VPAEPDIRSVDEVWRPGLLQIRSTAYEGGGLDLDVAR